MSPFDVALFAAAVRLAAPLLFAAIGELISERAGVLNIGLEGMMLAGAFTGFLGTYASGSTMLGLLCGVLGAMAVGALMALFSITLGGDQIVVGVALNLLVAGATLFCYRLLFVGTQPTSERMSPWEVPLLSQIPGVGPILFAQLPLVYAAYLLVPLSAWLLWRTRTGLALRATGDLPAAVTAAGGSPARTQWGAVLACSACAGLGGSFLSVVQLGFFAENMTAGRGFLALAAVVFGRWRPGGILLACTIFGFTDALQLRLQSTSSLPRSVWALLALAGLLTIALSRLSRLSRTRRTATAAPRRRSLPVPTAAVLGTLLLAVGVWGVLTVPALQAPPQLWLSLPYLLSLVILAVSARSARAPTMVGRSLRDLNPA